MQKGLEKMKKKNPNRRKKTDRSEFATVMQFLVGKAMVEIFKATNTVKTSPEIIDIPYEDVTEQKQISQ